MQRNSSLRQAFDNILLKNIKNHCGKLAETISSSLERKVGLIRENEWDAKLSHKTAEKLNAKGGFDFKGQPRMQYDQMCAATQGE